MRKCKDFVSSFSQITLHILSDSGLPSFPCRMPPYFHADIPFKFPPTAIQGRSCQCVGSLSAVSYYENSLSDQTHCPGYARPTD